MDFLLSGLDAKQQLRLVRYIQALGSGVIQSVMAVFIFMAGGFRLEASGFALMMAILWAGHLTPFVLIRRGVNRRFADPSMTRELVIWSIIALHVTIFFMDAYRPMMMMFYPLVLIFGAFSMTSRQYAATAALIVVGYGLVIALLFTAAPESVAPLHELTIAAAFVLVILAFTLLGNEISRLRQHLRQRTVALAEAIEKIQQMAVTDELTGLINRRHMMSILRQQKALADRGGAGFCVCFFDLDRFKRINDELGHRIGDIVLQRFADIARSTLRLSDHFSRFGGEEFVLLAVDTDLDGAAVLSNRIRNAIAAFSFGDVAPSLTVTVSGGVARFRPGERIETVLSRADKALYRSKNQGRDRITTEEGRSAAP